MSVVCIQRARDIYIVGTFIVSNRATGALVSSPAANFTLTDDEYEDLSRQITAVANGDFVIVSALVYMSKRKLPQHLREFKPESPDEIMKKGELAAMLRDNASFEQAITDLYHDLVEEEDKVVSEPGLDNRAQNEHRAHYQRLRVSLTQFVYTLDGYIREANNVADEIK